MAFVLGQMQHSAALPYLSESLRRRHEHSIVRHESAEALGSLEDAWEEVDKILNEVSCHAECSLLTFFV